MKLNQKLRESYNKNIIYTIRQYTSANKLSARLRMSLRFLLKCRSYDITPNFIKNSTKNTEVIFNMGNKHQKNHRGTTHLLAKHRSHFHRKLLNLVITQKHEDIKFNDMQINKTKSIIEKHLEPEEYKMFLESEGIIYRSLANKNQQKPTNTNQKIPNIDEFKK